MTSKKYTTYFLGAGASANALPMVNVMPDRMKIFHKCLSAFAEREKYTFVTDILNHVLHWIKMTKVHGTPDTYAKMLLFSRNFTEYGRFKDFLSLYFLFEQQGFLHGHIHLLLYKEQFDSQKANDERRKEYDLMKDIENPFDARYSQLVGSIFDSTSIDKPSDSPVRVITWNYDLQLERLFSQIRDTSFFESYIDLNGDKFDSTHKSTDISKIFITRLNGFAGFLKDDKFKFPSLDNQVEIITEFLEYCLTILSNTSQKKRANGLYFSWDEHANSQKLGLT
jgi:hypothetical protein